nr:hypothetical protein [Terribacillus saccharophilus]
MYLEELSKIQSEDIMSKWHENTVPELHLSPKEEELRNKLIDAFNEVLSTLQLNREEISKKSYQFDMEFGIRLYSILDIEADFTLRKAANLDIWRYLSIKVVPDIVYYRWGLHEGRYWKEPRRIWLKAIWWYIYLSWQGNESDTTVVLKDNTTDEIVQLVERAGSLGYRVNLTREIIKRYGALSKEEKGRNNMIFRKVMKLNTARVKTIEPELHPQGHEAYVKELFDYFDHAKETVKSN